MADRLSRSANNADRQNAASGVTKVTPRRRITACRRCHARKTKCSGQRPCHGCTIAGLTDSCSYILQDRTVKVNESYLQRILAESESARHTAGKDERSTSQSTILDLRESLAETGVVNPLIDEKAWFVPHKAADIPTYIGESACTAFATSLRQVLDISCSRILHAPRTHYVPDTHLFPNASNSTRWPSESKARLLVRVAFTYVGQVYHIMLASATFERLDEIFRDSSCITDIDTAKFFALFALGEAYSMKSTMADNHEIPGIPYFIVASMMVQNIPERATLELVENLLLLSFYSHMLNRRHSAYHYIGSALRLSMTLGLHHSLPQYITIDPITRQHRIGIWWTIYICDRIWGSELGHPASLQDSSITVEMPSIVGLDEKQKEDFLNPDYAIANMKLARIVGNVMAKLYTRNQTQPFLRNVRVILQDLKDWKKDLPDSIKQQQTDSSTFPSKHIISLHMSFNQCVILATRPVLLHILEQSLHTSSGRSISHPTALAPIISTLGDASIQAARYSNDLQTQAWINGTLSSFGYFDAHYIFSSAIILAISSILTPAGSDKLLFETASQILQSLVENGNLSAAEFYTHLESVQETIGLYWQTASNEESGTNNQRDKNASLGIARITQPEMDLNDSSLEEFLLDEMIYGDDLDFFNPLVGFQDESILGTGFF